MSVIKLYARGMHHGSIFRYDVPSHRLMNRLIRSAVSAFYDALSDMKDVACIDVASVNSVLRRYAIRARKLGFLPAIVNRCRDYDYCMFDFFLGVKSNEKLTEILRVLFDLSTLDESDPDEAVSIDYWTAVYVPEASLLLDMFKPLIRKLTKTKIPNVEKETVIEIAL